MFDIPTLRREWLSNPRRDILAGIVVALALIPEAIGFSIIAGVDPRVGLYASFSIAVIPHTHEVTTLGSRTVGDRVNLEADVLAKYVERLVRPSL